MLPIFQQITASTDVDQICNLELGPFRDMPIHIHCKDLAGKYIGGSERVYQDVGFKHLDELLGRTDYDVDCLGENEAASFTAIDKYIIKNEKTEFFTQKVTLHDNKIYIAMNHKTPLRSISNKVVGVISFGALVSQWESGYYDPKCTMLNIIFSSNIKILETLTGRQIECLYHVVRGLSNRAIARKLQLSHRTVEHYIDAIKLKWGCQSRADLVSQVLMM